MDAAEVDEELMVKRWRNWGKDRLYVNTVDGHRVGWYDRQTEEQVLEIAELEDQFELALARWHAQTDGRELPAVGAVGEPAVESVGHLEPAWDDLGSNVAGASAANQAQELLRVAPVRTAFARFLGVHTAERAWRIGAKGEQRVGRRLAKLGSEWKVLHAVPVGTRGSDIDHVVIGPSGVFTLNTKHHPKGKVWIADRRILLNGHATDYLRNARHEAERATRLLSTVCGFEVSVIPGLVIIAAEYTVKAWPTDVIVSSEQRILSRLEDRPLVLSQDAVEAIYEQARRSTTWLP